MVASMKAKIVKTLTAAGDGFYIMDLKDELGFVTSLQGAMALKMRAVEVPFAAEGSIGADMD